MRKSSHRSGGLDNVLTLHRPLRVSDGSGGFTRGTDVAEQQGGNIFAKVSRLTIGQQYKYSRLGVTISVEVVVRADLSVLPKSGDYFIHDGTKYMIKTAMKTNDDRWLECGCADMDGIR